MVENKSVRQILYVRGGKCVFFQRDLERSKQHLKYISFFSLNVLVLYTHHCSTFEWCRL